MRHAACLILVLLLALALRPPTVRAGEEGTADLRAEIIRRIDARLAKEMARLRKELIAEVDRRLAARSATSSSPSPAPAPTALPDGYRDLLDAIEGLRKKVASRPETAAPSPPETRLGAQVTAVPDLLRVQLSLPGTARFVTSVAPGSPADSLGVKAGDVLLDLAADGSTATVLRRGSRVRLPKERR